MCAFGAVLVATAVILPGVAGASASSKNVPAGKWVDTICTSFGDWIAVTGDIDTDLLSGVDDLAVGNTTAKESQKLTLDNLDEAVAESEKLAKETKAAGTPRIDGGKSIAKKYRASMVELGDVYRDARRAIAKLETDDEDAYLDDATAISEDTIAAFDDIDFPLDQLLDEPEIEAAMNGEPACQELSTDFPTVPFVVGDCLDVPAGSTPTSTVLGDFIVGSCNTTHSAEVFSISSMPEDAAAPFPGDDVIATYTESVCLDDFEAYVGLAFEASIYDVGQFTPNEETWDLGDREVVCMLTGPGGAPLDGPAQGSAT